MGKGNQFPDGDDLFLFAMMLLDDGEREQGEVLDEEEDEKDDWEEDDEEGHSDD